MKTKWQNIFLDAGTEKGLGDLSMMIGVVSDLFTQQGEKYALIAEDKRRTTDEENDSDYYMGYSHACDDIARAIRELSTPLKEK